MLDLRFNLELGALERMSEVFVRNVFALLAHNLMGRDRCGRLGGLGP